MRHEVQMNIGGNWQNVWTTEDSDGNAKMLTFASHHIARAELHDHFDDMKESKVSFVGSDYRIAEVAAGDTIPVTTKESNDE